MRIVVSAPSLKIPAQCACCGSEDAPAAIRLGGYRGWEVHYCRKCQQHVELWPAVEFGPAFLLTLLTLGLFLLYYWYRQSMARDACQSWCAGPAPAVRYLGGHATRHTFEIASRSFAGAFLESNLGKVVSVDSEAKALYDELIAARGDAQRAREATPALRERPDGRRGVGISITFTSGREAPAPRRKEAAIKFLGPGTRVQVAGRNLESPLLYVSSSDGGIDASTVVLNLAVGQAEIAAPLPYWPSYAEASPAQRARYLDWLSQGRTDPSVEIGYPFIFFYGLERRALVDEMDQDVIIQEVLRLREQRGEGESSFAGYSTSFLAFVTLEQLERVSEDQLHKRLGLFARNRGDALDVLLAWYAQWCRPLPSTYASIVATAMEGAKGGSVARHAADELSNLFAIRYRDQYGDGLVPIAAKNRAALTYHPASATLARSTRRLATSFLHVMGRPSQFNSLLELWNACVDDLRKLSSTKRKIGPGGKLDADAWAALPPELRLEHEHPDQARWDDAVARAPRIGALSVLTGEQLGDLAGRAGSEKLTTAQLRRIGEIGADLGFAMEPEPRLATRAAALDAEFAVWRSATPSCPPREIYQAAFGLLSLGLSVAIADGTVTDDEVNVISQMLHEMVPVDEALRARLEALRVVLVRQPARVASVARRIQETTSAAEREKIGRVLVLVAAADGMLGAEEHKSLRSVYRALGLAPGDLDAALLACDLRLASDAPVMVDAGSGMSVGESIPKPPVTGADKPKGVLLNSDAIAAIMAETREVASMLSAVLDDAEDESPTQITETLHSRSTSNAAVQLPAGLVSMAASLDHRYHGVLCELVKKSAWNAAEIREMGTRMKLMPGGILEAINAWSDEHLGDYLIEERGDWHVRIDLLERQT